MCSKKWANPDLPGSTSLREPVCTGIWIDTRFGKPVGTTITLRPFGSVRSTALKGRMSALLAAALAAALAAGGLAARTLLAGVSACVIAAPPRARPSTTIPCFDVMHDPPRLPRSLSHRAAPAHKHVQRALARHMLPAFVPQRVHVDAGEQALALTQQHGPHREVQLVDQPRLKILPDGEHAAAEAHVAASCGRAGPLERGLDAIGHEDELRPARHLERRARMVRQDEDRRVIRRLVSPPALPALVRPRAADGPEQVAADDPGAEPRHPLLRDGVVDTRLALLVAVHLPPDARGEEPLEQLRAPDTERVLEILVRAGRVAVDRDRE